MDSKALARLIDHTLLKPDATESALRRLCAEAREHSFYSVCVNPRWVELAARELKGSSTVPITVVGFPLGASTSRSKAFEATDALGRGAAEIDMVIDIGAVLDGRWNDVESDIQTVARACGQAPLKVILETSFLTLDHIRTASQVAVKAGAAFVKTSTGFAGGGATVEAIRLMRETVGPKLGVKASGGIRDRATAEALVAAGANRLGCSASVAIVQGTSAGGGAY